MAFIDRTYFYTGELFIPNLSGDAVQEKLDHFITVHEPKCLQKLLGYELWKEFTTGLLEDTPEQKWTDLRDGVEFTGYNGRVKRWMGLTGSADAVPIVALAAKGQEEIQVDVTTGFTNGTTTVTFDGTGGKKDYRGYRIIPERTGTGTMRNAEYNWNSTTGKWDLLGSGDQFQPLEVFNITFEAAALPLNAGAALNLKQSIIANYVYYWFMRDVITTSSAIGEVTPQGENSVRANPGDKMQRAWMQLMEWVCEMREFISQRRDDYPSFFYHSIPSEFLRTVNTFGI